MDYLTADSIKTDAAAYTAALAKSKFNRVLNDTRLVRGPRDHSMDWVINYGLPARRRPALNTSLWCRRPSR